MDITEGETGNTPPFVNTKGGGRPPPCWKSNTIITHAAVNGPSGFKSKHQLFLQKMLIILIWSYNIN